MHAAQCSSNDFDVARFRAAINDAPLAVYDAGAASFLTIPASLDPLVVDDVAWRSAAHDAPLVLRAMERVWVWLRESAQSRLAAAMFGHLSGVELDAAFGKVPSATGLATVRFDFFFDGADLKILEVNTTIPAMQAYSDMARAAFAAALPSRQGEHLAAQSNVRDLLGSLLRQYDLSGGRKDKPRIAIVARDGDSQLAELRWMQKAWAAAGHEVLLVAPAELAIRGSELLAGAVPIDLVYRHIFAHRLTPGSDFERACRESLRYRVFNPVSAHLEVKALLAETSRVADSGELSAAVGLVDAEVEAVRRRVPRTRLVLRDEPSAQAMLKEKPRDSLVLKTSSGYGGHGVVIGATFDQDAVQKRLGEMLGGRRSVSWDAFCSFAAAGAAGLWVVQERVEGRRISHRYLAREGTVVAADSYVDGSMFGGLFERNQVPGGASRFSADPVVNIGRGGGLMPLILQSEAAQLEREAQP